MSKKLDDFALYLDGRKETTSDCRIKDQSVEMDKFKIVLDPRRETSTTSFKKSR